MTPKILTPMETSLLDAVNRMQSDHQKERSHLIQQVADLRKEVEALRSMHEHLAGQQAWQTQILTALQPLLGLALPPKD
jgi:FtsZ-binding cell division protein ZapB